MRAQYAISHRHMLAMSAAAGGLAIGVAVMARRPRRESGSSDLIRASDAIIDTSQPVQELASGFRRRTWTRRGAGLVEGRPLSAVQRHPQQQAYEKRDLQGRLVACDYPGAATYNSIR
jgi:hypothetical protein